MAENKGDKADKAATDKEQPSLFTPEPPADEAREKLPPLEIVVGEGEAYVPGPAAPAEAGAVQRPPGAAPAEADPEAAAELRRQLDEERKRSDVAERLAAAERERAQWAERNAQVLGHQIIDDSIKSWSNYSAQLTEKAEQALAAGNYRAAAEIQREMAKAEATVIRLQEQKEFAAQAQAQAQQAPPPPQQQQPMSAEEQTRAIIGGLEKQGFRRSADWLRSHPEVVANPRELDKVQATDRYVTSVVGLQRESDAYFQKLEEMLGMRQETRADRAADRDDRGRFAAAPVRSSAPSLSGQIRRQSVTLSSDQREHASVMGMTDEEYAAELVLARDQGKLLGAK